MRLCHAVIVCWIILINIIGLSFANTNDAHVTMIPSTASVQPKVPLYNNPNSPTHSIELDIPPDSYFASLEGRNLLKYLVRCALDDDTEAHLNLSGEKFSFIGGAGFAPAWAERALNLTEQRWVSACIFALTNKLGKSVRVDLRAIHPKIGKDTDEEKRNYPLYEGGFFGNLFLPTPVSYVCEGADRKKMLNFPIGKLRLCAQPSGVNMSNKQEFSKCGFIITGPCNSPSSFVVNGEHINEVIHTWLPPKPVD